MTISVAAAYVANDGGTSVTSGNFDIASGDLLVMLGHCDTTAADTAAVFTLTDNQTPDLTFTNISQRDGTDGDGGGVVARYHIATGAVSGYNATLAVNGVGGANDSPAIKFIRFQAADFDAADVIGASTEANLTTDPQTAGSITPETAGTGVCAWTDWNQTGTPTSSDLTMTGFNTAGDISGGSGYKTLSAGVGATANINSGAAPSGNYLWFEVRTGAPSGALTGASSLAFSATGTLTGAGALSGASTLTFSPVAVIQGFAPISGASTITFAAAGSLTGAGALSGSTTLSFAPTSTLTGSGALSGSASITFDVTGVLDELAPDALSGSSSISFTVVGVLTGTGDLSGSTALTFVTAGNLIDASAPASAAGGDYFIAIKRRRRGAFGRR